MNMIIKNSCSYFKNIECEYFPCNNNINPENFNCIFCFCPLYNMENCGGNYTFTEKGIKDCSNCTFPHIATNYTKIISKFK